ncbi:hypothetical protein [Candidatus Leptofilum sp.]
MSLKTKLAHLVVAAGLMLGFLAAPTAPPSTNGDCSSQTSSCGGSLPD